MTTNITSITTGPVVATTTETVAVSDVLYVRLRADFIHWTNAPDKLVAGTVLSSQDYNLDKLLAQGAQMDLIDIHTREVICGYETLQDI